MYPLFDIDFLLFRQKGIFGGVAHRKQAGEGWKQLILALFSLYPRSPRNRLPLSGTEEGWVPRCRRRCSPVRNAPFLCAGQAPAQKEAVDGVRERISGFLLDEKNSNKRNSRAGKKII